MEEEKREGEGRKGKKGEGKKINTLEHQYVLTCLYIVNIYKVDRLTDRQTDRHTWQGRGTRFLAQGNDGNRFAAG